MLRIMQLVDGLPAGLTRRLSAVGPFQLDGILLTVREYNRDARCHRSFRLAVLSGQEQTIPELGPAPPMLGTWKAPHHACNKGRRTFSDNSGRLPGQVP
ncbi:MAG: hypothetical protein M0Z54_11760 [Thermaerobacter sp.]|nr:hypothetical protein [Thermaerobacter sp.]